ncbi:STS [Branchiostoma lanceolatum]|uniref:STS protein n=1 Tax=Branchiostoma lanceolatum TaxID=7740 RepID=A0A8K0A513_BRALA|nr:STS [Branchiostoma lanceolatum]
MAKRLIFILNTALLCSAIHRPNFVLFLADDLGIGDVGCFGNDTLRTPNIDRLAATGAKLTHHIAAASVCTPSRAAFLTGRLPIRMGMAGTDRPIMFLLLSSPAGLPTSEITFAQLAKNEGYQIALIGKWHLGMNCEWGDDHCHHPNKYGFDYFYGLPLSNGLDCDPNEARSFGNYLVRMLYGDCHLFEISVALYVGFLALRYFGFFHLQWKTLIIFSLLYWSAMTSPYVLLTNGRRYVCIIMRDGDVVEQPLDISTIAPKMTAEAVKYIEQAQRKNSPFLIEIAYSNPHTALVPAPQFRGASRHGLYGDSVEEMDWSVGVVMATLEKLGLTENTFVYFTSDNGGHRESGHEGGWNGVYKGGKGQGGSEGGIRVPTVMQWPRKIKGGTTVREPTSQMDILPTMAGLIGARLPADRPMDGRDLMPLVEGQTDISPHEFMFHYCGRYLHAVRYRPRQGNTTWKVHYITNKLEPGIEGCRTDVLCMCEGDNKVTHHRPPLLYDVTNDPSEIRPISVQSDAKCGDIIARIEKGVEDHRNSLTEVEDQFKPSNFIPRPWMQPCCNVPFCSCTDDIDLSGLPFSRIEN